MCAITDVIWQSIAIPTYNCTLQSESLSGNGFSRPIDTFIPEIFTIVTTFIVIAIVRYHKCFIQILTL